MTYEDDREQLRVAVDRLQREIAKALEPLMQLLVRISKPVKR